MSATPRSETTLRTMLSFWLEQTDALAERLAITEGAQNENAPTIILSLRRAQHAVALLFAHKAQFTPEKYAKLVGAMEKVGK